MTVSSVGDNYGTQSAWVDWFDSKHEPKSGSYPLTSLELYEGAKIGTGGGTKMPDQF
jgi:hypothetical protein